MSGSTLPFAPCGASFVSPGPLVCLKNVNAALGGRRILHNLNWALLPGEHWAFFGANGAGKSSFLRLLRGDLRPEQDFAAPEGSSCLVWNFADAAPGLPDANSPSLANDIACPASPCWPDSSPLAARPFISLLSPELQHLYVRQGWKIDGEELLLSGLGEGYLLYEAPSEAEKALALQTARDLRAERLLHEQVTELSQGQLRLLLLGRALIKKPRLLLLDEALDGLDKNGRQLLFSALELFTGPDSPAPCSVVCVSHRNADLPACLNRALLLRNGRIAFQGGLEELRTKAHKRLPPNANADAAPITDNNPENAPAPIFALRNVDVYLKGRKVLQGLNWQMNSGENWLLSGPNGAGKSTLIRLLLGEEHPALGGSLTWFDASGQPARPTLEERHAFTAHVSDWLQNHYEYELNGLDLVISGLHGSIGLYRAPLAEETARAEQIIALFGLAEYQMKNNKEMSEGLFRRFLLARAMVSRPRLLLLDEPCSGLDYPSRNAFMENVRLCAGPGRRNAQTTLAGSAGSAGHSPQTSIILVSHNPEDRAALAPVLTHELALEQGKIAACARLPQE